MPCATCGELADFSENRDDSQRSDRPAGFERLSRLGVSFDSSDAYLCPACGAAFDWYRDRDSDTGITSERIHRLEGARAISVLIDTLAWPWPIDKPAALLEALRARVTGPTLEELLARTTFDREHLVRIELLGRAAAALAPKIEKTADTEAGARALAAIGAFDVLEAAARAGQRSAIRALARSGPASCEATLVAVLTKPSDPLARAEAASGLGRLGVQAELLERTLATCQDSTVINGCRDALAAMRATDTLCRMLEASDWSIRRAAAEGLGAAGVATPQVLDALKAQLFRPSNLLIVLMVAFEALMALGLTRDQLEAIITQAGASADPELQRAAKRFREELASRRSV